MATRTTADEGDSGLRLGGPRVRGRASHQEPSHAVKGRGHWFQQLPSAVVTGSSRVNEPDRLLHLAVAKPGHEGPAPDTVRQPLTRSTGQPGPAEARGGITSAGAQRAPSGND